MISDETLICMVRTAATEKLPVAVMTINELRHFAEVVAFDCIRIIERPDTTYEDIIKIIKERYEFK